MRRLAILALATCLLGASPAAARKRGRGASAHAKRFGAALGLFQGGASAASSAKLDSLLRAMGVVAPPQPIPAPDFVLPDVSGRIVSLRSYRGRVVLLNFWATWCPPCRAELPDMARLEQAFADDGLAVVTVATDPEGARAVKPILAHLPFPVAALLDTGSNVAAQYAAQALPTSYLIDREGRIVGQAVGRRYWFSHSAQALLRELLFGPAESGSR